MKKNFKYLILKNLCKGKLFLVLATFLSKDLNLIILRIFFLLTNLSIFLAVRGLGQNAEGEGGGQAGSRHETIEKTSNLVSIQARDHGPVAPVWVPTNIIKSACVCSRCIESEFWR